jgi:CBS domain-containing membrane protein
MMTIGRLARALGLIQLPTLAQHHNRRIVYALFVLLAGGVSIAIIATLAFASGRPFVVPSLGPTAFLVFNRSESAVARPRNILAGHLTGAVAGYVSLLAFGLAGAPSVLEGGMTAPRIGAAALSIALTSAVMILMRTEHGPAGATTLIVSLGFMTSLESLAILMGGVIGLTIVAVLIDRLVGIPMPLWSGRRSWPRMPAALRTKPRLQVASAEADPPAAVAGRDAPAAPHLSVARGGPVPGGDAPAVDGHAPPLVLAEGEGRRVVVGSAECTVKVEEAACGGAYSLLELELDPLIPSSVPHSHYDFAESYYVLDGQVVAELGDRRCRVGPGATIRVPVGMPHLLMPSGQRPAHLLCVTGHARQSDLEFLP